MGGEKIKENKLVNVVKLGKDIKEYFKRKFNRMVGRYSEMYGKGFVFYNER